MTQNILKLTLRDYRSIFLLYKGVKFLKRTVDKRTWNSEKVWSHDNWIFIWQIQVLLTLKNPCQFGVKENYLKMPKGTYKNSIDIVILGSNTLKSSP